MGRAIARSIFLLMLGALAVTPASAGTSVDIGSLTVAAEVDSAIDLLEDPEGVLTRDTAAARFDAGQGVSHSPNIGFTTAAWWARLLLENTGSIDRTALLRQEYPLIDQLDVWRWDDGQGGWQHTATGDATPFATRPIEHRDFVFPIVVPAGESRSVYLRYQSQGPIDIALSVYPEAALIESVSTEQLAFGFYYGSFMVLVLYNLVIYLVVRDRAFLHYLLYVGSYGLYMAVHNGFSFQFLWPDYPAWGNTSLLVLLGLSLLWGMRFSRTFVNSAEVAPLLDRLGRYSELTALLAIAASFVLPYRSIILPISLLTIVVTVLILLMGLWSLAAGYRPARFFMLAWSMLLLGVLIYMCKIFGLVPHNLLTQNGFQVGSLLEMILLSLALGSRVNELQRQTLTDALTGLSNRRFFDERLIAVFARARERARPLTLLMVDIDYFKRYNDHFGHARGDQVLRRVGEVMTELVVRPGYVCRYGGEEFAVILPDVDLAEGCREAERLRRAVEAAAMDEQPVTVSIGVASLSQGPFNNATELLDAADLALYAAKSAGRNRTVQYESGMDYQQLVPRAT